MEQNDEELFWLAGIGLAFAMPAVGIPALALGSFAKWGAKPTGKAIVATAKGTAWAVGKALEKSPPKPKPYIPPTLEQSVEAEMTKLAAKIRVVQGLPLDEVDKESVVGSLKQDFLRKIEEMMR